jgi:hypothetical protein
VNVGSLVRDRGQAPLDVAFEYEKLIPIMQHL